MASQGPVGGFSHHNAVFCLCGCSARVCDGVLVSAPQPTFGKHSLGQRWRVTTRQLHGCFAHGADLSRCSVEYYTYYTICVLHGCCLSWFGHYVGAAFARPRLISVSVSHAMRLSQCDVVSLQAGQCFLACASENLQTSGFSLKPN
jgi:hypothetical protein